MTSTTNEERENAAIRETVRNAIRDARREGLPSSTQALVGDAHLAFCRGESESDWVAARIDSMVDYAMTRRDATRVVDDALAAMLVHDVCPWVQS